ncbi:SAM-dependent methyltransferase, partial [Schumannella luteola]
YLLEPDGAVIRARLIGELARRVDGRMIDPTIAWITSDASPATPFGQAFRVREVLPFDERKLKSALRERGIGTLEIKKRGVDVDPASLRARLGL